MDLKFKLSAVFLLVFFFQSNAQNGKYSYFVNLNKVSNDQLTVELEVSQLPKKSELIYNFPKIVPGAYEFYDFGRFISDFQAFDLNGNTLKTEKADENSWNIYNCQNLKKITYKVDDTFDAKLHDKHVFESSGTSFDEKNVFFINSAGVFGYFENTENYEYSIKFEHPKNLSGSTALSRTFSSPITDIFFAESVYKLYDSPILYASADTSTYQIGNTKITIAVYDESKQINSKLILENATKLFEAQKLFFNGNLPTETYTFLFYFTENLPNNAETGALEHNYSSAYFLESEKPTKQAIQEILNIMAHEFLHILTPLNVHSKEIQNFNYQQPNWSKHLWMYEGITEYFAHLSQVQAGLINKYEFLDIIHEKIIYSKLYYNDTLPFTNLSDSVIFYESQYNNVYEKGALIAMCLDIRLLELSNGEFSLRDLMFKLSEIYGKRKAFEDDELFDKIAELSFQEIKSFFKDFVSGSKNLQLKSYFEKVGVDYNDERNILIPNIGLRKPFQMNGKTKLIIGGVKPLNKFGKKIGLKKGDEILSVNNIKYKHNFYEFIGHLKSKLKENGKFVMKIKRKGQIKQLKATTEFIEIAAFYDVFFQLKPTENAKNLQNIWLNQKL